MEFELYTLLATGILLISIGTILFSIYSYILFRVREVRKLKKTAHGHGSAQPAKVAEAAPAPVEAPLPPNPLAAAVAELEQLAAVAGQVKSASGSRPALATAGEREKLGSTSSRERYRPALGFQPPPERPRDLEPVLGMTALAAAVGSSRARQVETPALVREARDEAAAVPAGSGGKPEKAVTGFFKPYRPKS